LVEFGYNDTDTQVAALLHDAIVDTELLKHKHEIERVFDSVVYSSVYNLSNNTIGKHSDIINKFFNDLSINYLDESGLKLTPELIN
jgi:(p)ppGpp synthase/HD superfamily hydrolase